MGQPLPVTPKISVSITYCISLSKLLVWKTSSFWAKVLLLIATTGAAAVTEVVIFTPATPATPATIAATETAETVKVGTPETDVGPATTAANSG